MEVAAQFGIIFLGSMMFGVVFYLAIRAWSDGEFTGAQVIMALGCWLLYIVLAVNLQNLWSILVGFVIWGVYIGFIGLQQVTQRRLANQMRAADYAACHRVLARDPRNVAAHEKLARLLEADNKLHEALASYDEAVQLEPGNEPLKYRRKHVLEQIAMAESAQLKCPHCGTVQRNQQGYCWRCGRVFDLHLTIKSRLARAGHTGTLVMVGGSISLAIALISLLASAFGFLYAAAAGICITLGGIGVAVSIVWMYRLYARVAAEEALSRDHDELRTL